MIKLADFLGHGQNGVAETRKAEKKPEEKAQATPFAKSILVVLDGSDASVSALKIAVNMKSCLPAATLSAAFVVDTASMDMLQQMRVFVAEERSMFEQEIIAKGQRVLDSAFATAEKQGVQLETYMLKGRFSQAVMRACRELKCDLLVICGWHDASTHKDNSSVERQLVVDHSECPVLVIKG